MKLSRQTSVSNRQTVSKPIASKHFGFCQNLLAESEYLCYNDEVDFVASITNESKISYKLCKTHDPTSFTPCVSFIKFDY